MPTAHGLCARRLGWLVAAAVAACAVSCALPPTVSPDDPPIAEDAGELLPAAGGLTPSQHEQLRAGARVEQFVELERQGQRYVGGVGYVLVRAEPYQVFEVLNRVDTLAQILPGTRSTRVVDRAGGLVRVALQQGNSVVSTSFTIVFQLEPSGRDDDPRIVRFWLDPSAPHGIDDAWGFFRATRYDGSRSLISVGALVNLGPGVVRMLFEERIQRSILRTPNRIRDAVERAYPAAASAGSARTGRVE